MVSNMEYAYSEEYAKMKIKNALRSYRMIVLILMTRIFAKMLTKSKNKTPT